jgi:hypothetical protein
LFFFKGAIENAALKRRFYLLVFTNSNDEKRRYTNFKGIFHPMRSEGRKKNIHQGFHAAISTG